MPPTCTTTTAGPCSLTTCPTPPTPPATTYDDAGALTITGGTPTTIIALIETADHSYTYPLEDTTAEYAGGLTIAGTGATVPAFTQSVVMPAPIEIDAPTNAAPIPRSSDLTVTWSHGGQNDRLVYELYQTPYASLTCSWAGVGDAGSYTIPSSLMQGLAAGAVSVVGFGYATTNAMVGDYATVFETGSIGQTSLGGEYNMRLILQ